MIINYHIGSDLYFCNIDSNFYAICSSNIKSKLPKLIQNKVQEVANAGNI